VNFLLIPAAKHSPSLFQISAFPISALPLRSSEPQSSPKRGFLEGADGVPTLVGIAAFMNQPAD
jgi:hypothetical protein